MAVKASETEKKFLDAAALAVILKRVLKVGAVDPEDIRRKVCFVGKITPDEFDEWIVDRFDLMQKAVRADLLNQLLVQANVRKKAETDADLGLKVLERRDSERWRPNQKIEVVIENPRLLFIIGQVTKAHFDLTDAQIGEWAQKCQEALNQSGGPSIPGD